MLLASIANYFTWDAIWEYIGYLGSILVLISFVMTSVVKLRWVSAIGSAIFAVYGFVIGSIPTGLMNTGVVIANIYHLIRMKRHEDLFTAYSIRVDNEFIQGFMLYNGKDIQKYFDGAAIHRSDANIAILVYCNMTVAGLLLGKDEGNGLLRIDLDYATPEYRDCRVGKFLYQKLSSMGFCKLVETTENAHHARYLTAMGFTQENGAYSKDI